MTLTRKYVAVVLVLFVTGMMGAQEWFSSNGSLELSWNPYAVARNENSYLNHKNALMLPDLVNQASSSFWFDLYFGNSLTVSGQFQVSADTLRSVRVVDSLPSEGENYSTLGDISIGFEQLYFDYSFPNYWTLGYGKYPVRFGYSRIYSPFNYVQRTLNFLDTVGQWNAWFKGHAGPINFAINYFPSIQFQENPNDKTDVELFFSTFETPLERQTWTISVSGFFFGTLDTMVFLNIQDKTDYEFSDFYLSGGTGFSWSILPDLIWRGAFMSGNGYDDVQSVGKINPAPIANSRLPEWEYIDRDADVYYPKALTGLTMTIPGNIEFTVEYYYNGAGLDASERKDFLKALEASGDQVDTGFAPEQQALLLAHQGFLHLGLNNWKIFELGQHYAFLQFQKLGLFKRLDIFNTSVVMVEDFSFFNITSLEYSFSDQFSLNADIRFFLFQGEGIYSLAPERVKCELEAVFTL